MQDELTKGAEALKGLLNGGTPIKEAPEETQEQAEQDLASEEATDMTEEVEQELTESDEEEVETRATEAEQETPSVELEADEFASLLNIDTNSLEISDEGPVRFKVKGAEGEEDVTLDKLINSYQGDANLTNRSKQLAELEKQRKAEIEKFTQESTKQAQQQAVLLEHVQKTLNQEYESINWKELMEDDPGAAALKKQEFNERKAQMDGLIRQALNNLDEAQAIAKREEAELLSQKLQTEQESMMARFKQMGVKIDSSVDEGITKKFSETFTNEQIEALTKYAPLDVLTEWAYKVMQYDKGLAKAQDKKVKKLPKVMKPGQKPSSQAVNLESQRKLKQEFKNSGGDMRVAAQILKKGNMIR